MRLVILVVLTSFNLLATARTWVGTSGDGKWSTTTNWSPNGAVVSGDNLTFNNTCTGGNCASHIDTNAATGTITIASTYPGILTQNTGISLTTVGTFSIAGGTFTGSSTGGIIINQGGLIVTGGTLTLTGETVTFGSNVTSTFTCTGDFNATTGATVTINKTSGAGFTLTTGCTLAATVTTVTGALTIPTGATFTGVGSSSIIHSLVNTGGTFNAGTITGITVDNAGAWDTNLGTTNLTGTTLTFTLSSSLSCGGNFNSLTSVSSVVLNNTGTFTLNGTCNLSATITIAGTLTLSTGTTLTGVGSSAAFPNFNNSGTFNAGTITTIAITNGGTWDVTAGTTNLSGVTLTWNTASNPTFNCTGNFNSLSSVSAVTIIGAGSFTLGTGCTLSATVTLIVSNLTISSTAVFNVIGIAGEIKNLLNSGTFVSTSGTLTVDGNWTNSGIFTHNNGSVVFSDVSHTIAGSSTFYNLTMVASGVTRTITFPASATQTIVHNLSLNGLSGKLLVLNSSSSPTQWLITPGTGSTVSFVDVKDSNATSAICAPNSTNSGNNVNWYFQAAPCGSTPKHRVTMR